jgi:hypothetical protein
MKQGYPGQPPLERSSSLFTEEDRRSAAAHNKHISAGVQETPGQYDTGKQLSEQQKEWIRSMERAEAARDEIKNLNVDVILQNCEFKLALSGRSNLSLQISFKDLVLAEILTTATSAQYASEKDKLAVYEQAREYIARLQNPPHVARVSPVGRVAAAAVLNPWSPRGDFGGK